MAVSGQTQHTWRDRPRPYDFYDLTGAISKLADHFCWGNLEYVAQPVSFLEDDMSFKILCRDEPVGIIGKVTATLAAKLDIKQDVYLAELSLEPLMALSGKHIEYEPLPVYPSAPRDLAVVVDEGVKTGDLVSSVKSAAGELAEEVEIFDLYRGKQSQKGMKSIAIAINYRSREGNLSSDQVDEKQRAVVKRLQKDFNAQIRDK